MSDGPGSFALRGVENLTRTQLGFEREDRIAIQQQFQNQLELRQQQNRNIDANIRRDSLLLRQQEAQRIIDARIKREDVMNRILDSAKTPEQRLALEARFNNFATAQQIQDKELSAQVTRLTNQQTIREAGETARISKATIAGLKILEKNRGKRGDVQSELMRSGLAKQGMKITEREADLIRFKALKISNDIITDLATQKVRQEQLALNEQFKGLSDLTNQLILTGTPEPRDSADNSLRFRKNSENPANRAIIDQINNTIANDFGATNILEDPIIDIEIRGGTKTNVGGLFVLRESDLQEDGVFRRPQPISQVVGPRIAGSTQFQLWSKNLANLANDEKVEIINQPRTIFSSTLLAIHNKDDKKSILRNIAGNLRPTEDIVRRAFGDLKTELSVLSGTDRPSVRNLQLVNELAKKIENEVGLDMINLDIIIEHLNASTGPLSGWKEFQSKNTDAFQKLENILTLAISPTAFTDIEQKKAQRFSRDVMRRIFVDLINVTVFDKGTTVGLRELERANKITVKAINDSKATKATKRILLQKLKEAKTKAESRLGAFPQRGPLTLNRSDVAQ